ncbi:MAG: hypothetical protein AAGC55_13305 [Myxococcota bacterium]
MSENALLRALRNDWRRLFPWRHRLGSQIRAILDTCDEEMSDARAAFGQKDASSASPWLFRDFYIDEPPAELGVERAVGKLRRGNPSELAALLAEPQPEHIFRRMWYEVSTLVGEVLGSVVIEREGETQTCLLEVMPRRSHDAVTVVNEAEISALMGQAISRAIGIEPHRQNLLKTLGELQSGSFNSPDGTQALALLIHHADLSPRGPLQWQKLSPGERGVIRAELDHLQTVAGFPPHFLRHLRDGLRSPCRQRRFLSYRLLRLDGHLGPADHPDDRAVPA